MIPENKNDVVKKALLTAFDTDSFEHIEQLTKGLSSAQIYKIIVRGNPYLLRVIMRTDAMGDPSFYYNCMQVAAEHGVAPAIHYMSIEDRISITDFITEQPFPVSLATELMPQLVRKVHALPKFAFRINYFEAMERSLPQLLASDVLPATEMKAMIEMYERIKTVYPFNDIDNWVSSHNDSKPENFIFDGQRPWSVDWEAAFLNDRYLDLAIVGNFVVMNDADENVFLDTYFEEKADAYKHARFFLMQQVLHLYYFIFLIVSDKRETPLDINKINKHDFREFHNGMWRGDITLVSAATKREYALLHLEAFCQKAKTKRFDESLHIVANA